MTKPDLAARRLLRRLVGTVTLTLVLVEAVVLRHYVARAVTVIAHARPGWVLAAVACALLSMGFFARLQRRMLRAGGTTVSMPHIIGMVYAANAVNVTLPGGTALSAAYVVKRFTAWGASAPVAGFAVIASGVLSSVTFAGLALSCGVLAGHGDDAYLAFGGAGLCVLAVVGLRQLSRRTGTSRRVATRCVTGFNRAMRRERDRGVDAVRRFFDEIALIHPHRRDWLAGAGFAALNWLADLGCLIAACHAVGLRSGSVVLILAAYLAGMTASSVSFLPGGVGVIDVAMVLALTGDHVPATTATAAVLLYRMISCLFIVGLGWAAWLEMWIVRNLSCNSKLRSVRSVAVDALRTNQDRGAALIDHRLVVGGPVVVRAAGRGEDRPEQDAKSVRVDARVGVI
jgi:putative heme transporter